MARVLFVRERAVEVDGGNADFKIDGRPECDRVAYGIASDLFRCRQGAARAEERFDASGVLEKLFDEAVKRAMDEGLVPARCAEALVVDFEP